MYRDWVLSIYLSRRNTEFVRRGDSRLQIKGNQFQGWRGSECGYRLVLDKQNAYARREQRAESRRKGANGAQYSEIVHDAGSDLARIARYQGREKISV